MPSENALRAAITNVNLPTTERRNAATILVKLQLAGVPEPSDDDVEVEKLRQPWPRSTPSEAWLADFFAEGTSNRSLTGYSRLDARASVLRQRRRARLEKIVMDPNEDVFVRDVANLELRGPAIRRA